MPHRMIAIRSYNELPLMIASPFRPTSRIRSAGRSHRFDHHVAVATTETECRALIAAAPAHLKLLPFGAGQSLGDSCLNDGNGLIVTSGMTNVSRFDRSCGLVSAQPGSTLASLVQLGATLNGQIWFPAVLPGNMGVTFAGAIANDVHGKNHSSQGSFCHHVERLTLLRSDGTFSCDTNENSDLFRATLGGLGLTGIIVNATAKLRRVSSLVLENEDVRCDTLGEAFSLLADSKDWEYRFVWLDPFDPNVRGVFTRARHCEDAAVEAAPGSRLMQIMGRLPIPGFIGGPMIWRAWYALQFGSMARYRKRFLSYRNSLAPLGEMPRWNRLLGSHGLLHFQFVTPKSIALEHIEKVLSDCRAAGELPCIASAKIFGVRPAAGLLSFPREGVTVALDFANAGISTRRLLRRLEAQVIEAGGAIYPGKDSTLSPQGFRRSFPAWETFARFIDPRFSSSFWRRVGGPDCC
jgi:FAD binding domain